ncbi:hypothetical protein sos41_22570 [Alphaproteobacteria bacterium SO-S41]|nr:hypothetical protein sos41_22570 [Alphaproteobacteria bacterium SO-S41]
MSPEPPRDRRPAPGSGEIYIEVVRRGNAVVATAIDPVSGKEASATGPVGARGDVERLAVAKLERLVNGVRSREPGDPKSETPPVPGRGIIV